MKVSHAWLSTFFATPLPTPEALARALTFHAWEVEEVVSAGSDTVLDIKVLPDKTPHALSHRGVAKELSVILELPLSRDPISESTRELPTTETVRVSLHDARCTRYEAARISGVRVGPSPEWLVSRLEALGQRSINNVVDVTNYVMFELGQPLHAFDAAKLAGSDSQKAIGVRSARNGESITVLTGETYTLSSDDMLIVDGTSDEPIGIAGIKGGLRASVDSETNDIIIESAHFDPTTIRRSSRRLKLRTDASMRFENGCVPGLTDPALALVVTHLCALTGGELVGVVSTPWKETPHAPVLVRTEALNSVLGTSLTTEAVERILARFGYHTEVTEGGFLVTPPMERTDITIEEDLIEEIGRIHGYEHVPSIVPEPLPGSEVHPKFALAEQIRDILTERGFSEIFTSSFRAKDEVHLKNALASDKSYLRSTLRENMYEALERNVPHRDMLGLRAVLLFEIGTVFSPRGESFALAIGVRHGAEFRPKLDNPVLTDALASLAPLIEGVTPVMRDGVLEVSLSDVIDRGALAPSHEKRPLTTPVTFVPFSPYPTMSRDVALFVPPGVTPEDVAATISEAASPLLIRLTLFDTFTANEKTSYAFRLVFQSEERTLTAEDIAPHFDAVIRALTDAGYTIR